MKVRCAAPLVVGLIALLRLASAAAEPTNVRGDALELERALAADPLKIVAAQISRPKAAGDITLKADVVLGEREPMRVKLRKAVRGAEAFNNTPRYDLAAYELQKLLVDPVDFVVPPTALRMIPAADLRAYEEVEPTFRGSDDVLNVIQYWLQDVTVVADVYDAAKFAADPIYATHVGQLNIFTVLIGHRDSNAGNFLISSDGAGARVFSVDNGVAFAAPEADRGELWRSMRVDRLPAATVARLRQVTRESLTQKLAVLAQWQLKDGHYVPVPPGSNLAAYRGVRVKDDVVQMGLTSIEISGVWRRCRELVEDLDKGKLQTF